MNHVFLGMFQRFIFCSFVVLCCFSCTKKQDGESPIFPEPFQIHFTMDGKAYDKVLPLNDHGFGVGSTYDLGNGEYFFTSGAGFSFTGLEVIDFEVGSGYGPLIRDYDSAFASLLKQFALGPKVYDSIAWSPQKGDGRVELFWLDANGDGWYTTKHTIVAPHTVIKSLDQAGSSFMITFIKPVNMGYTTPHGAVIKGTFNCTLYKEDTPDHPSSEKKKLPMVVSLRWWGYNTCPKTGMNQSFIFYGKTTKFVYATKHTLRAMATIPASFDNYPIWNIPKLKIQVWSENIQE